MMSTANEFELDIHQRLLAGDRAALIELAEAYLAPVRSGIRRHVRWVPDETLIDTAAADSILKYAERPARYDPNCASLLSYLVMDAYRDLLNALKQERRRTSRLQSLDVVEFGDPARNTAQKGTEMDIVNRLSAQSDVRLRDLWRRLAELFPDRRDQEMLELILDGERKTEPFARILGIEDLPIAKQREIVKDHKDRIKVRLRRLGVRFRDQETN
jgi:hypothetical protein